MRGGGRAGIATGGQGGFDDAVLAPLEGEIVLLQAAEELGVAFAELHLHVTAQQREVFRVREQDDAVQTGQLVQHFVEQATGALVEGKNLFEIQNQVPDLVHIGNDIMHHGFGAGEVEVALELVNLDLSAVVVKCLAFLGSADAVRVQLRPGELQADGRFARARPVEQMQIAVARESVAHADAAHAVATGIQRR